MKKNKNWKLTTKLRLPYIIILVILLIDAVSLFLFMYNFDNYSRIVDVAGETRMYSQKISYTAELITRANKNLQDELEYQANSIDKTIIVFEKGGYIKGYKKPFEPLPSEMKYMLMSVKELWIPFKENIDILKNAQFITHQQKNIVVLSDSTEQSASTSSVVTALSYEVSDAIIYIESHSDELLHEFDKLVKEVILIKNDKRDFFFIFILSLMFLNILVIISGFLLSKSFIIKPIEYLETRISKIAHGNILLEMNLNTSNSFEKIINSLQHLKIQLIKKAEFINEISTGNYNNNYEIEHENDTLGVALLKMKEDLILKAKDELERNENEKKQNWLTQNLADFGEILRQNNNDIEQFSFNLVQYIVNSLNANQSGLFLLNEDDKEDIHIELISAIAFDKKKYLKKRIELGEGLVGRVVLEKKSINLKVVPEDYINITSGLGQANPRSIVLVPLILNNEVFGVIELASFKEFEEHELEFLNKAAESIASTLLSVKTGLRTAKLLEESQNQRENLAMKEEEMINNMDELRQVQTEAKIQEQTLSSFTESVNRTLIRAEYTTNGKLIYANNNFLKKLKYGSIKEIENNDVFSFFDKNELEEFQKTWDSLLEDVAYEGQIKHITKLDEEILFVATYAAVRNADGEIHKILFLAIDITMLQ